MVCQIQANKRSWRETGCLWFLTSGYAAGCGRLIRCGSSLNWLAFLFETQFIVPNYYYNAMLVISGHILWVR
jgi:hypothetical protein